jgi:hypothetical protein
MPTALEKAQAHFDALPADRGDAPTLEWTQDGITFYVYDPYITESGNGIGFTVEAEDANGPLPTDNPYQFFNPPLGIITQLEVGEWQWVGSPLVLTWVVTTPQVIDTSDVTSVTQQMVYDAVVSRALALGWAPA